MFTVIASQARLSFPFCLLFLPFLSQNNNTNIRDCMGTRLERGVSMRKRIAGLVMCFVVALPLAAQVDRASVGGTVTDASGAVVKGAKVGAESSGTGFQRWTVTSDAGTFHMTGLPIGIYKVTVEKDGFRSITI